MSEEVRFETTGVLDDAFFKENAKYLLSSKYYLKRLILGILLTVLILAEVVWLSMPSMLIVLAIYWGMYYPLTLLYQRRAAKILIKRQREAYPDGRCEIVAACVEEGVRCENRTSGGTVVVDYAHLSTMALAKHAYILMSKASQFTVFFTDGLTEQEKTDLQAYLREKCPKLKIIR